MTFGDSPARNGPAAPSLAVSANRPSTCGELQLDSAGVWRPYAGGNRRFRAVSSVITAPKPLLYTHGGGVVLQNHQLRGWWNGLLDPGACPPPPVLEDERDPAGNRRGSGRDDFALDVSCPAQAGLPGRSHDLLGLGDLPGAVRELLTTLPEVRGCGGDKRPFLRRRASYFVRSDTSGEVVRQFTKKSARS